jgi:hypothetical protein
MKTLQHDEDDEDENDNDDEGGNDNDDKLQYQQTE